MIYEIFCGFNIGFSTPASTHVLEEYKLRQIRYIPKPNHNQKPLFRRLIKAGNYIYNLCIARTQAKSKPLFYVWTEHVGGRGATEIGSTLFGFLSKEIT